MLEALIAGQRDPAVLPDLAKQRLRQKIPALTEALHGRLSEHHAFMARLYLDRIDAHTADIARLDGRIEEAIAPFRSARELLMSIPGCSQIVADVFIAETGAIPDLSKYDGADGAVDICVAVTRMRADEASVAPACFTTCPHCSMCCSAKTCSQWEGFVAYAKIRQYGSLLSWRQVGNSTAH